MELCLTLCFSPELAMLPDVVNDLDVDFTENMDASSRYKNDARNIRKVQEATKNLQVNIIHPLRQGKKLLVLDIDYSKCSRYIYLNAIPTSVSHLGYQTFD